MPRFNTLVLWVLPVAMLFCGCRDNADSGQSGSPDNVNGRQEVSTAAAEPAAPVDAGTEVKSTDAEGVEDDGSHGEGAEEQDEGFIAGILDPAWRVANLDLGITVDEARNRLPVHDCIPIEENWATENYTGILSAGTYDDPIGRLLSVVCFEGKVVGIVDSVREVEGDFGDRLDQLLERYGPSRSHTPDFAQGRQFIYEMIHANPAPDFQYMWSDEDTQSMFFAAHFKDAYISNYVLIDAARYDYAAAAMAQRE